MKQLILLFLLMISGAFVKMNAQTAEVLTVGLGYKLMYTPPSGWNKVSGFLGEKCWSAPDNMAKVCLSTRSKTGSSADLLLESLAMGQKPNKCERDEYKDDDFVTVWKECEVSVSGRVEGRLWSVTIYNEVNDAVLVEIQYRDISPENLALIMSTVGEIELIKN